MGEIFDTSLPSVISFLDTANGRDKLGKLVHYSARCLAGASVDMRDSYPKNSPDFVFHNSNHLLLRSLFVRLMEARRTNRWLMSLKTAQSLTKPAPWDSSAAFYVSQAGMLFWQVLDHLRWLQEIGWIRGDPKAMKRLSFKGFVLSALINVWYFVNQVSKSKEADSPETKRKQKLMLFRNLCNLIATTHISEMYTTSEPICGLAGAISASIDLFYILPRKVKLN